MLGLELGELKLGGFDLALTGFGELELGDLLADRTQGLTNPDDTGMSEDEERDYIRASIAAVQEATGTRPVGCGPDFQETPNTLGLLAAEGIAMSAIGVMTSSPIG